MATTDKTETRYSDADRAIIKGKLLITLQLLQADGDIELRRRLSLTKDSFEIKLIDNSAAVKREFEADIRSLPAGSPLRLQAAFASFAFDYVRPALVPGTQERKSKKQESLTVVLNEAQSVGLIAGLDGSKPGRLRFHALSPDTALGIGSQLKQRPKASAGAPAPAR